MALTKTEVSELYVSIFNRVSEKSGSENWVANGGSAAAIADLMLATDDAKAYFGTSLDTNAAFVEHIYNTTLNKGGAAVDVAGKQGWVDYLNAGNSKGAMVELLVQAVAEYEVGGTKFATADQATKDAAQQFVNRVAVSDDAATNVAAVETGSTATFATKLAFGPGGLTVTSEAATVVTAKTAVAAEGTAQAALIVAANMTPAETAAKLIADAQVVADAKLAEAATEAQAVLDAAAKVITDAADAAAAVEAAAVEAAAVEAAAAEAAAVEAAEAQAVIDAAAAVEAAAAAEAQAVIDAAAAEAASPAGIAAAAAEALTADLGDLVTAQDALAAFQVDNADTAGDLTGAQGAYDVIVGGTIADDSAALTAALLGDKQTEDGVALGLVQVALSDAQIAINGGTQSDDTVVTVVTGLSAAIAAQGVTAAILVSADGIAGAAVDALNIEEFTYNTNAAQVLNIIPDTAVATVTQAAGDTYDLLVTIDDVLVLNPDPAGDESVDAIAEAEYPGITALLVAVTANNSAIAAAEAATTADNSAAALVERLDIDDADTAAALTAVGEAMTQLTAEDSDNPTAAEVTTETASLQAGVNSLGGEIAGIAVTDATAKATHAALTATAVAAEFLSAANKVTLDGAFDVAFDAEMGGAADLAVAVADGIAAVEFFTGYVAGAPAAVTGPGLDTQASTFFDLVGVYDAADGVNAPQNPLSTALNDAEDAVVTYDADGVVNGGVQFGIDALATAITDLADAEAAVASEDALDVDVAAALAAFTDAGLVAPQTLDNGDALVATSSNDIFTVATETAAATSSVTNFGLLGDDTIFVGTGYTSNTDLAAGDNTLLELFITDNGTDTTITIEHEAFSSETDATETVITLTGVTDLTLGADGFIA
jgi:hypothetical protein